MKFLRLPAKKSVATESRSPYCPSLAISAFFFCFFCLAILNFVTFLELFSLDAYISKCNGATDTILSQTPYRSNAQSYILLKNLSRNCSATIVFLAQNLSFEFWICFTVLLRCESTCTFLNATEMSWFSYIVIFDRIQIVRNFEKLFFFSQTSWYVTFN